MTKLTLYECRLRDPSDNDRPWFMRFWAEDEQHAREQCADAMPANDASTLDAVYEANDG